MRLPRANPGSLALVAAVVFAFGNRPGISADDARELVQLLETKRNAVAFATATKIWREAKRDPDRGETSEHVDLEPIERSTLLALLQEPSVTHDNDGILNLRRELEHLELGN